MIPQRIGPRLPLRDVTDQPDLAVLPPLSCPVSRRAGELIVPEPEGIWRAVNDRHRDRHWVIRLVSSGCPSGRAHPAQFWGSAVRGHRIREARPRDHGRPEDRPPKPRRARPLDPGTCLLRTPLRLCLRARGQRSGDHRRSRFTYRSSELDSVIGVTLRAASRTPRPGRRLARQTRHTPLVSLGLIACMEKRGGHNTQGRRGICSG